MFAKPSLIFLSLSTALELVLGSSVKLTYPKSNSVLEAGSTVNIKWRVNNENTGLIRLQYASGKATSLAIDGIIADNVNASLGTYAWKIPKDIKAKRYVIEAGPSAKDLSFAGYVTIKNKSKKTTTTKKVTSTKKKTTKKTSVKKTSTKKTSTKKTTTKKSHASAVCVGYPSKKDTKEYVRCHSVPEAASVHKKKKSTTKKPKKVKKAKKTTKKSQKKTTTTKHK
ncbi:hypothetical protein G6F57_001543 [Rhizopus arrhizus]|nr:hypothetical protein G6F30_003492 [Rhizopus arrhizus]KAG1423619.1 hypothetical protein G6F58_002748 [Rhizopus delemar]KAG0989524.1 hypothetical protein G6F29_000926 [Rhizopus arrhizus]KAG0999675.1 hypothetical protein G6F28_000794 [Rhizopus arrhizus]KAG1012834.1 hypothetical protein G6F27_002438 [Rhizopus arrhizus]